MICAREDLPKKYERVESYLSEILEDKELKAIGLKTSARNRLESVIKEVEGAITAKITIEIQAPATITAIILKEATEELNLKRGDTAQAVIKATEVMTAKQT